MEDVMMFPKTIEEFINNYSFKDREEVYTNGAELIPVFRVEQALEHYIQEIRNKAIEEFAEAIKTSQDAHTWCCNDLTLEFCVGDDCKECLEKFKARIDEIAESMKGEE